MLVGYARVSTQDQDLALQLDALHGVGCNKVEKNGRGHSDHQAGARPPRPSFLVPKPAGLRSALLQLAVGG